MAWTDCRDRIVAIVEGTTPTTQRRGTPSTFKHIVEAGRDGFSPGARGFWLQIREMRMKGQVTLGLPRWFSYDIDLVVTYPLDSDPTLMFEILAADHAVLAARLPDQSLWGQPSSTIEGLFLGRDQVLEASVDISEDDTVFVTYPLTAEFRQT